MDLVRKLVYAQKETELDAEYQQFKSNTSVKRYPNFLAHVEGYSVEVTGQYALEEVKP